MRNAVSRNKKELRLFDYPARSVNATGPAILNKERFAEILESLGALGELDSLRSKVLALRRVAITAENDDLGIVNIAANGDTVSFRRDVLVSELDQILAAHTLERSQYYVRRLLEGVRKTKTSKINDINLARWKEYDDITTDSLWVLEKRDTSGAHLGWYWGNFIPQIPHQMMLRYTKKGDWVLDPFVGSGTTLIECRKLGRNGVGIELNGDVAEKARLLVDKQENVHRVVSDIIVDDSMTVDTNTITEKYGVKKFQFIIAHPPYHDIISFSDDKRDLSRAPNIRAFLDMFGLVIDNVSPLLEANRYFAVVIGDKYSKGEWIPLGFYCMNEAAERGFQLKSIIVKNFDETRAKRNQKELWRYRALVGGFYVFKHEYILLFQKKGR